ncbi:MAG: ATP-binding protein [Coriobacteriales bacterium]|jgi:predicted AAA+ superfamily ATPase|nr:ATP-binding protein [Coriobacteriales bacterium]
MIERSEYMNLLIGFRDKQIIKIITGIRRCGKSTLLANFQEHLLKQGVSPEQILSINFEDFENESLRNPHQLHDYIKQHLLQDKMNYLFLDEVQEVEEYQKVVDSFFIKKNVDLYLTGSNAHLLSGDLATLLSGRYVEIEMLPFSFKEYVATTGDTRELARKYTTYLTNSSFPFTTTLAGNQKLIQIYLRDIYSTVLLKDVLTRNRITDPMMMESLIRFVFDNIGSQISTKKISDAMNANYRKIDVKTVEKYLNALVHSYIIYQAKRYDIKGKEYLKTLDKYYVVDIGMRYLLLGNSAADTGHILENVIYLELLRRGYRVYIGKVNEQEVDFVAMDQTTTLYLQVAATLRDPRTLARELEPLQRISDNYPKYLLTLDEDPEVNFAGIICKNALDWLLT